MSESKLPSFIGDKFPENATVIAVRTKGMPSVKVAVIELAKAGTMPTKIDIRQKAIKRIIWEKENIPPIEAEKWLSFARDKIAEHK